MAFITTEESHEKLFTPVETRKSVFCIRRKCDVRVNVFGSNCVEIGVEAVVMD